MSATACEMKTEYGVTWLDGKPYIGITKMLRSVGVDENIAKWQVDLAIKNYAEAKRKLEEGEINDQQFERATKVYELTKTAKEKRQDGAASGSNNHTILEAFATGDSEKMAYHKEKSPQSFSALDNWLKENKADILLSEVHVFSGEIQACGRFDAVIRTPKGRGVYELKSKDRIFFEFLMQASFYKLADVAVANGMKSNHDVDYAAVLLSKDGFCREVSIEVPPDRIKTLLAYKSIFREKNPDSPIFKVNNHEART